MTYEKRDFQIPTEWTERILSVCPSQTWRTLNCLWRHAGAETTWANGSETVVSRLREQDVVCSRDENWTVQKRRRSRSSNQSDFSAWTRASVRGSPFGGILLDLRESKEEFWQRIQTILFDAGLDKWGTTFQNMRSSCENDWVLQGIPAHVVASWMGHSVKVQEAHYLRVLPQYYQQVTG